MNEAILVLWLVAGYPYTTLHGQALNVSSYKSMEECKEASEKLKLIAFEDKKRASQKEVVAICVPANQLR
jgi:hypothetical protein